MKKRFEYKTIEIKPKSIWSVKIEISDLENELNKLGMDGWEVVTMVPFTSTGTTQGFLYTLKREL
ncbi:DUF4177 domain-containing protein [Epilithonimonas sp.]|uniref:DUF4177 domain-containing protein n=1 Tax=Epilithonimonas sp. TaxID=2894511 RepID=UPI00289C3C2B|nr:DUF4177 domain-containing protein [Epilithonimonas sp.]